MQEFEHGYLTIPTSPLILTTMLILMQEKLPAPSAAMSYMKAQSMTRTALPLETLMILFDVHTVEQLVGALRKDQAGQK